MKSFYLFVFYTNCFSAYVNGIPVYLINGEHNFNPVEGEHESFDVVEPQENQRIHLDNLNGRETIEYQEPLESDVEDLDYYENDDEDYPLDSLSKFIPTNW